MEAYQSEIASGPEGVTNINAPPPLRGKVMFVGGTERGVKGEVGERRTSSGRRRGAVSSSVARVRDTRWQGRSDRSRVGSAGMSMIWVSGSRFHPVRSMPRPPMTGETTGAIEAMAG